MLVAVVVVVVVVVVPEELELLEESSSFAQEMMVRLKNVESKMNKIFFIFFSNTKRLLLFVKETTLFYHKFVNLLHQCKCHIFCQYNFPLKPYHLEIGCLDNV